MIYLEGKIKTQIEKLYTQNHEIHVNLSQTRPKLSLRHAKATIVGVYAHFFRIEVIEKGIPKYYSIRYADILPNHIDIEELKME